jgi:hypothetical protein
VQAIMQARLIIGVHVHPTLLRIYPALEYRSHSSSLSISNLDFYTGSPSHCSEIDRTSSDRTHILCRSFNKNSGKF